MNYRLLGLKSLDRYVTEEEGEETEEEGEHMAREGGNIHREGQELHVEEEELHGEGSELNRKRRGILSSLGSWYKGHSSPSLPPSSSRPASLQGQQSSLLPSSLPPSSSRAGIIFDIPSSVGRSLSPSPRLAVIQRSSAPRVGTS